MLISAYQAADLREVLDVFDCNVPKYFAESERAEFEEFLGSFGDRYLVGREEGKLIACGGYAPHRTEPGTWTLCWGMVAAEHHRRGLGAQLLRHRLDAIAATGPATVVLATSQHSAGFFERFGFVTANVVPDGFAPGIDQYDMRLRL
ncbi:GNAT family N-acetyltransferase [Allokutzneria sp. A3M-2-11 16]|uniref:GNAT family N-acetyltransferase n=1 Tax=Allokutzneria sp. A3M-2-11 16 TaxID=2962043 RepID=UPI0020B826F4|nr:GNAT family N-acetyltransferase [Allokutzneria sp. A3M-2-11 16]MCP3804467.1 GNAT family N-acetyltransferase [Allokutzneria sp. A3M-2-11 16]